MNILANGKIAVGAPGSPMRVRDEYADIIAEVNELYANGQSIEVAKSILCFSTSLSRMERESVIYISKYGTGLPC